MADAPGAGDDATPKLARKRTTRKSACARAQARVELAIGSAAGDAVGLGTGEHNERARTRNFESAARTVASRDDRLASEHGALEHLVDVEHESLGIRRTAGVAGWGDDLAQRAGRRKKTVGSSG